MRSVLCVRCCHSLDHLPFDDGYLVWPLTFRHKKGEYFVGFCLQGEFYLFWLELVEFRLYLGASLCTLHFLALAMFLMGYSC